MTISIFVFLKLLRSDLKFISYLLLFFDDFFDFIENLCCIVQHNHIIIFFNNHLLFIRFFIILYFWSHFLCDFIWWHERINSDLHCLFCDFYLLFFCSKIFWVRNIIYFAQHHCEWSYELAMKRILWI